MAHQRPWPTAVGSSGRGVTPMRRHWGWCGVTGVDRHPHLPAVRARGRGEAHNASAICRAGSSTPCRPPEGSIAPVSTLAAAAPPTSRAKAGLGCGSGFRQHRGQRGRTRVNKARRCRQRLSGDVDIRRRLALPYSTASGKAVLMRHFRGTLCCFRMTIAKNHRVY
jgi:hypothetical protein